MWIRRLIAITLITTLLGTQIPNPPEAEALDTGVIVAISIVSYFSAILLATWWLRNRTESGFTQSSVSPFLDQGQYARRPEGGLPRIRFGFECRASEDGPSLFCW